MRLYSLEEEMRITAIVLATCLILLTANCITTEVTRRTVAGDEVKEGPARIVRASEVDEEKGVISKPAEPDKPEEMPVAGTDEKVEQLPEFKPRRTAEEVSKKKARKLLEEMKPEVVNRDEARARKLDEMLKEVKNAEISEEKKAEAEKKFEEAEKLHSQKKSEEAAAAYQAVLEIMPTHKEALERLKQCYDDMDKAGTSPHVVRKPASAQDMLLIEQMYSSAVRLYEEGKKDEALKKFTEVVSMIKWAETRIDTKGILEKAQEYVERIKIEKELAKPAPKEKEDKEKKEEPPEKEGAEKQPGQEKK